LSSLVLRRLCHATKFGLVLALTPTLAFAEPAQEVPRYATTSDRTLPAPFVLPELSHPRMDARLDWFIGRIAPELPSRPTAIAAIVRPSFEASILVPRRLYVGLAWPFASALPPDGGLAPGEAGEPSGRRVLLGNIEGECRLVLPMPTSLEIGFHLGVVVPTSPARSDVRADRSAIHAVSTLDPANYAHFAPDRVGLRPAADVRIVRGPIVFQGREGLDFLIHAEGTERIKVAGRLLAHLGYVPRRDIELSIEATHLYFLSSEDRITGELTPERAFAAKYRISDGRRSATTIGPAVRFSLRDVDVGASLVTNLGDPLSPASVGFVVLRVSVVGHIGPRPEGGQDR